MRETCKIFKFDLWLFGLDCKSLLAKNTIHTVPFESLVGGINITDLYAGSGQP